MSAPHDSYNLIVRPLTRRALDPARGTSLGRPFKLTRYQWQEALARREGGELLNEIARSYIVSSSMISRLTE